MALHSKPIKKGWSIHDILDCVDTNFMAIQKFILLYCSVCPLTFCTSNYCTLAKVKGQRLNKVESSIFKRSKEYNITSSKGQTVKLLLQLVAKEKVYSQAHRIVAYR